MEFKFKNKGLDDLYHTGTSKKYSLSANIVKKFIMRVLSIEAAINIYDLWKSPSLKFEKLEGTKKYSMRLNREYRLEMEIEWEDEAKTKGIFNIIDVSKHYGD